MNAIEIKELTKLYGQRRAVDRLTLTVAEGELLALLGVNGAGKTTAIKMLSCLTEPTSGDALLEGHSITSDQHAVKAVFNVSPHETAVARNLTVKENLELMAEIYGSNRGQAVEKASKMIAAFALEEFASQKARTLSGGWQRRLSIAMALISNPKILFLDEPTLGLDILARRELWQAIEHLKGDMTIILTTHYLEEAEALADRIAIMEKGRLKALGTADELIERTGKKNFEEAFIDLATITEEQAL